MTITDDLDIFACGYCGSNQKVYRSGGVVALRKVEEAIKSVQRGTDRTAAELTLARLSKELSEQEAEYQKAAFSANLLHEITKFISEVLDFAIKPLNYLNKLFGSEYQYHINVYPIQTPKMVELSERIQWLKANIDMNRALLDVTPANSQTSEPKVTRNALHR